jgi:3-oxoacyl-[acyl-carrier protein] reductase
MDLQLNDAIVLIAGSSRGIGLATAKAFLEEGAKVMITGRDRDDVRAAKEDLVAQFGPEQVFSFSGDLCEKKDIDACLTALRAHWGDPTCVVANIGRGRLPKDWQFSTEQWEETFRLNFRGSVLLAEAVLPAMRAAQQGSIVFTASIAGVEDIGAPLPYAAAKAALIEYSKGLATQVAAQHVRVNCVAPGNILFPGGSWEQRLQENAKGIEAYIQENVPLRRFGTPKEIADMIVFLSSPRSAFTTGTCVVVDGGQTSSL